MNSVEIVYRYAADDAGATCASRRRRRCAPAAGRRQSGVRFAARRSGRRAHRRSAAWCRLPAADLGARQRRRTGPAAYAAVLGCSDARVPIELVFGEGPNDLFVDVRVAGGVLGAGVLASLKVTPSTTSATAWRRRACIGHWRLRRGHRGGGRLPRSVGLPRCSLRSPCCAGPARPPRRRRACVGGGTGAAHGAAGDSASPAIAPP